MSSDSLAQQAHQMSITEIIIYAATAVGGVVGGVLTSVLRFGTRVKELEAKVASNEASKVDASKARDEMALFKADVNMALATAKADPAQIRVVVEQAVASALPAFLQPLRDQVTRLEAQHQATAQELHRVRDEADRNEREGADRWAENAHKMGRLEAVIKSS